MSDGESTIGEAKIGVFGVGQETPYKGTFPDERALDVAWDYDETLSAFVSEWIEENSHIPENEREGIGVVLGGRITDAVDVFIQYDKTGNGNVDVTSATQTLELAYHTITFDDNVKFSDDGYYRIGIRGLRTNDTINQADIGAVHQNL
jgi:hypothetical protein